MAPAALGVLARLWPNRVHESSWLKNLACGFGLHRWRKMKFEGLGTPRAAQFCMWCDEIRLLYGYSRRNDLSSKLPEDVDEDDSTSH